jgi:Arc/MetJ-type ribon-helix-helix transcriptional regulator
VTIQITKPELEALIKRRLETGAFQDVEDVILEALRASESAEVRTAEERRKTIEDNQPGSVVAEMRKVRARVKPDPEGWTTRDYVNYGRR